MRFPFILLLTFLISCKAKEESNTHPDRDEISTDAERQVKIFTNLTPQTFNVDLKDRKTDINASSIISREHKIIKLETNDNCLIGEISKVIIKADKIFVLDGNIAKKLFCFDLQGNYLFSFGMIGDGPGEMDSPRDFDVTNDHVFIIDRQCRVFTFNLTGEYQSTFRLPFLTTQLYAVNDTSIFYYTSAITDSFKYYLTQVNNTYVSSFTFPIQSDLVGEYGIPQAFHKHDDHALFVKFLCDTIFSISESKVQPLYVIQFPGEYPKKTFKDKRVLEEVYSDPTTYGKLFNMHMAETSDDLFFLSSYDGINCHFISKKTGRHIFTNNINEDFSLGGLAMFPVGSHEKSFIFPITLGYMIQNYEKALEDFRKNGLESDFLSRYSELKTLYEKSDKEDNPALLLAEINPAIYEE